METDGTLFARAPLDGVVWLDALVHDPGCTACPSLRGLEAESAQAGTGSMSVLSGRARDLMVAASAVTVVSAVLTVVAH